MLIRATETFDSHQQIRPNAVLASTSRNRSNKTSGTTKTIDWQIERQAVRVFSWIGEWKIPLICLGVILSVSFYDTWLVYAFQDSILIDERNPICQALIQLDPDRLTWFFAGKFVGNLFVAAIILALFVYKYRFTNTVACSVASFQLMLTFYLCLADQTTGFLYFEGLFSYSDFVFWRSFNWLLLELAAVVFVAAIVLIGYRRQRMSKAVSSFSENFDQELFGSLPVGCLATTPKSHQG